MWTLGGGEASKIGFQYGGLSFETKFINSLPVQCTSILAIVRIIFIYLLPKASGAIANNILQV
jgi:hypothetical protein